MVVIERSNIRDYMVSDPTFTQKELILWYVHTGLETRSTPALLLR